MGLVNLSILVERIKKKLLNSGFITNTDYASSSAGGVIKTDSTYSTDITSGGKLKAKEISASDYASANDSAFVSKATLDNLIESGALGGSVTFSTTPQKIGKWVDNKDMYRVCIPFTNSGSDLNIDMVAGEGYVADTLIFECAFINKANGTVVGLNYIFQSYDDASLQPSYNNSTKKINMKGQSANNRGSGYLVILFTRTEATP